MSDALEGLGALKAALGGYTAPEAWRESFGRRIGDWTQAAEAALADDGSPLPSDAQVIGAVNRRAEADDIVVCAAGGLPGELHKLWRAARPGGYHLEYGYSCMGYEIAGGLGVKMAWPAYGYGAPLDSPKPSIRRPSVSALHPHLAIGRR